MSDGAPPHFSCHLHAFLEREFQIVGKEEGDQFPSPLILQI
jgi:hypothetical protein